MSKLKVAAFSISLDGFGAGPEQDLKNPLGLRGHELHSWFFPTETFQKRVIGKSGGSVGIDNDFAVQSFENIGAWIMGRNMFGPIRGPWQDDSWKGWWGEDPPYHTPVFVLTHYPRPDLTMEGGTTFHFVTDGPAAALAKAKEAAKGKGIRIGGGVSVIRQYLAASLIDEMHLAVSPVLLGEGEHLFGGLDLPKLGYAPDTTTPGEGALHVVIRRTERMPNGEEP
ncbi:MULTISPECIES: dihydrofolate reductase family protein [Acidobacteriaceae]|uniref:dihydrofolate reductase family protein n=1 Tax=Acidobacteriaceae TaxID=204434 RepID=UPI00131BBC8A|nr:MULTISPECIES: dihydrofolate reductase family protein [Acidobacteriaceae]MDW5264389.1 dihydrofolate reductase family protein [Edaphobacter sp.]